MQRLKRKKSKLSLYQKEKPELVLGLFLWVDMRLNPLKLVFEHFELVGQKPFIVQLLGLGQQRLSFSFAAARHGHCGELHLCEGAILLHAKPRI